MLNGQSWALLRRLTRWLDQFKVCFGHRAQVVSLRQYVEGLLGDSARKSMQAMLARVTEPASYQAFQHVITHAPWDAEPVWRRLRAVIPERRGILILDETSFPKQGRHSVGVARQYCGALGKVANCQVAVTVALWTGVRAWLLGATLYLPAAWATDPRRAPARIPARVGFQEKWRLALTLLRRVRAAGIRVTAVVGDSEYGDTTTFRQTLHRWQLPYALGVSGDLTVFRGTPTLRPRPDARSPRNRRAGWPDQAPIAVDALAQALPPSAWQRVRWRNGINAPWEADFAAVRVTPARDWRSRRLAPEVWLLCERGLGAHGRSRQFLINRPPRTRLSQLVHLAHQRWAIEQQYQDLKTELGFDHFAGRSYPGWEHHVVISAVAYAFLQTERMQPRPGPRVTFPQIRAITQEIFTGLLFASRPRYLEWMHQARQRQMQLRI